MENSEGAVEMFWKKQICPRCKTGKASFELDRHSVMCPHIGSWKNGKCHFFEPIEKSSKMNIFNKIRNTKNLRS